MANTNTSERPPVKPWPKANEGVKDALTCKNCSFIFKGAYCPNCGYVVEKSGAESIATIK